MSEKKHEYGENFNRLLDTYDRVLFCGVNNVTSHQLHGIRRSLRGKGELLMGKKTLQKKIIRLRADSEGSSTTDKSLNETFVTQNKLVGNLGMIFTNETVSVIQRILEQHRKQAPARVNATSPVEVVIPSGNTGLEPTQTSFFQALNIATKITKGCVEIMSAKKLLNPGDKVDSSTAVLLHKLKISPFYYALELQFVWERGALFMIEDLDVTDDAIEAQVLSGIGQLTALSLGAGVATELSLPHTVMDAFKNLLAVSLDTDYVFTEYGADRVREDIKEGRMLVAPSAEAAGQAAPSGAAVPSEAAAPTQQAPPPPEPEEEEDDDDIGLGGLF